MEKRDLYDENRELTGETVYKGEPIPEGKYIIVVLVYIQNSEGKFLIQKRSKLKDGKYATTGGHVKSGETSVEGILSEVREELGLELNPDDLVLYYGNHSAEQQVFWDDYYIKLDIDDISKLQLQEEEVESVKWATAEEMKQMMKDGEFLRNHYEEFEILLDWLDKKGE
jgi:8-oxo-dGTP pyrophosphatase MutT (NUDIX family)